MSTAHFSAVLSFSESDIFIPKRDIFISFGYDFSHNKAKKCPASCKIENITAAEAVPDLSVSKNAVSTAKKSGEILTLVLSTENLIKVQSTPSDLHFFRLLSPQNEGGFRWSGRYSQPPQFFLLRL